ncbi:MAG: phosphosulfolactate synthase [Rhodospirillales bacterium]
MASFKADLTNAGHPFLDTPRTPPKPRKTGWTVMSDRLLPLGFQDDLMEAFEEIVDKVKFVDHAGHMNRIKPEFLKRKNALYKARNIPTFPGGIPFEVAYLRGKVEEYYERLLELGFTGVEVSDDTLPTFPFKERARLIKLGRDKGLDVFSETGKKFGGPPDADALIETIKNDLDAGSTKVTIENAELTYFMENDPGAIKKIVDAIGFEDIFFEIGPSAWPELAVFLFRELGPEVNVENLDWDRVSSVEGMRHGLLRAVDYRFVQDLVAASNKK